jgi:hypothetical protein
MLKKGATPENDARATKKNPEVFRLRVSQNKLPKMARAA